MPTKHIGKQTVKIQNPLSIISTASIVGPKEGEGPLSLYYDVVIEDEMWGEKSWEKAESKLMRETVSKIINKSGKTIEDINYILAGDLLNQCIATNFAVRESGISLYGLYGACSTMSESIGLGAMIIDGGFADNAVCVTSSHFCSAEKQFRYPLELGSQRPPTAQWTVTGSGGVMLSNQGIGPYITYVTTGKIVDFGIKDSNNMGAAMAPAAADTIVTHFKDTGLSPEDYDLIITGDLGSFGRDLCEEIVNKQGYDIKDKYTDCGVLVYNKEKQDTHSGGSGCGCSAVTLAGFIYQEMKKGKFNNVLFVGTGALLSSTSAQQGESIPGIAHGLTLQNKFG
ncbi:MAG: stage V sporulation protein AD [Bacillota bacterium]|nr:stage V sporulation protein AD [Bacillota bacterium]